MADDERSVVGENGPELVTFNVHGIPPERAATAVPRSLLQWKCDYERHACTRKDCPCDCHKVA